MNKLNELSLHIPCMQTKNYEKNHNYSFNPTPPMFEILYYNFDERMSSKKDKNKFIFFVIVYL
jgi:hypothetical protein